MLAKPSKKKKVSFAAIPLDESLGQERKCSNSDVETILSNPEELVAVKPMKKKNKVYENLIFNFELYVFSGSFIQSKW